MSRVLMTDHSTNIPRDNYFDNEYHLVNNSSHPHPLSIQCKYLLKFPSTTKTRNPIPSPSSRKWRAISNYGLLPTLPNIAPSPGTAGFHEQSNFTHPRVRVRYYAIMRQFSQPVRRRGNESATGNKQGECIDSKVKAMNRQQLPIVQL